MKTAIVCLIGLVFVVSLSAEPLLEGRVRLESGQPVADAQVRLFDLTDLRQGAIARAMTDGTGYFALPLSALTGQALPERFALGPNYPNPFNPSTIIPYQLAASSQVRLEVFNLLGQHIATLVDGERPAGFHTATWHATDGAGRAVGAGVYIYRMTVGVERQTGRMVLIDGQAGVSAGGAASVMPGAAGIGGSKGADGQVYGLVVSGSGLVPYVDSSFRVEGGMASVELVVSAGSHSAGKATDDDCPLCDFLGAFNDQQEETPEEEAEADSTSSEGGVDLIVQSPSVSAVMLTPGEEFTLNVTVHNQGDEQAAATMLHYYRSNNSTITASDTEVGTDAIDALDASATSAASIALTAPTGVSAEVGIYYGACVDSVGGESNTDNNCSSAVRITVGGQEETEDETQEEEEGDETAEEDEDDAPEEEGSDALVTIPDGNLRTAIEAALGKARGAPITKAEMETLDRLSAYGMGISSLTGLEFATNLTTLYLGANKITSISSLRGLTNLTHLTLAGNNITDVSSLAGLTNLTTLYLGANKITSISSLRGLTNLTHLTLAYNNITDVSSLRGLINLTHLTLSYNNITDVSSLAGLTSLTRLYLDRNTITDISSLHGLTSLTDLNLLFNNITDVSSLLGLTNLIDLDLRGNSLSSSSINDHIPALVSGGTTVRFDQFRKTAFDIELVFLDPFTEYEKREIRYAARRWMSVITEGLPDYVFTQGWSGECGGRSFGIPSGERIDDLRIYVVSHEFGPAAGWGGPHLLRETTYLPVFGCMSFKRNWVNLGLALHEMGHVLGFGAVVWEELGFLRNKHSNAGAHFNGPLAITAFNDAGGRYYRGRKVPVEQGGGHWRKPVLGGELMVSGAGPALSAITIQSMADLGYGVDVTLADPYTLPGTTAGKASAKISAALPSIPGVDVTLADAYTLPGVSAALPSILGDDRLRGRLENAEWIEGRGFDFDLRDNRLMGRLAPYPQAEPKPLCGSHIGREPIYVIDPQGRIIRTLGD